MFKPKPVLVVGGYGAVGQYIVDELHTRHPSIEIIVAGRSLERATALAGSFGSRVTAAKVDLTSPESIDHIFPMASLVVLNTEAGAEVAALACIDHGIPLISIAASVPVLQAITGLDAEAEAANVSFITEVGLAPGLINLMARAIVADVAQARTVDAVVQLGMAGDHGAEAVNWTVERSGEAGHSVRLEPKLSAIGSQIIPVDFFDRDKMRYDLQVEEVTSSLALSPSWATRWLPSIAPFLIKHPGLLSKFEPVLKVIFGRLGPTSDAFALFVRASSDRRMTILQLRGSNHSRVTGLIAAKVAGKLLCSASHPSSGVSGLDDLVTLAEIMPDLEGVGCRLEKHSNSLLPSS